MKFINRLSFVLLVLVNLMVIYYFYYDLETKKMEISRVTSVMADTNPSFNFQSKEYREFVYVK